MDAEAVLEQQRVLVNVPSSTDQDALLLVAPPSSLRTARGRLIPPPGLLIDSLCDTSYEEHPSKNGRYAGDRELELERGAAPDVRAAPRIGAAVQVEPEAGAGELPTQTHNNRAGQRSS